MGYRAWLLVMIVAGAACGGAGEHRDDAPTVNEWTPMVQRLNAIEGITATEIGQYSDGSIVYDVRFTQPVDHANPGGATFEQRAILRYNGRSTGATVMLTDGYAIQYFDDESKSLYLTEPTLMFNANQLEIEHRYFGDSVPEVVDWSKLDIAQAAADHHAIRERLASIFTGTWIATGGSKSGMAALYYRFFYPDDVTATVSYVAPLMTGRNDERFATALTSIGDAACRDKLAVFQRAALDDQPREGAVGTSRRDTMVARYRDIFGATSLSIIGDDPAYELAVTMAPFTFWQYSDPALCADVPDGDTPDDVFFAFADEVIPFGGLTDPSVVANRPFRYQSMTQLGTPRVRVANVADLLQYDGSVASAAMLPDVPIPAFDDAAMQQIASWAATASERVLLVYGAYDPWTAGAIDLGSGRDALSFTVPQGNHGAHIADLPSTSRLAADDALHAWTGLTIDVRYRSALTLGMPERRDLLLGL